MHCRPKPPPDITQGRRARPQLRGMPVDRPGDGAAGAGGPEDQLHLLRSAMQDDPVPKQERSPWCWTRSRHPLHGAHLVTASVLCAVVDTSSTLITLRISCRSSVRSPWEHVCFSRSGPHCGSAKIRGTGRGGVTVHPSWAGELEHAHAEADAQRHLDRCKNIELLSGASSMESKRRGTSSMASPRGAEDYAGAGAGEGATHLSPPWGLGLLHGPFQLQLRDAEELGLYACQAQQHYRYCTPLTR